MTVVAYRPGAFIPLTADLSWDERALAGLDPAHPSPNVIGAVGEGDAQVELRQHPEVTYWQHPELIPTVERFRTGARRDVTRADYEALSNFELECIAVMARAFSDETSRELENARKAKENA